MLIHAYQEMLDVLIEHKKEPDDIKWVSVMEGEVDKTLFLINIEGTWYEKDSSFGELNAFITICGKDFCMRRARTIGNECWEYQGEPLPERPTKKAPMLCLWVSNNVVPSKTKEEATG
jgi:hypothetical protein